MSVFGKPNSVDLAVGKRGLSARIARVAGFGRNEDGSLVIFGLFAFVMMLLLAGVALDLVRFEERRTLLQNTIDRAALAAADLNQTLDPKEVVKDYFRKAGLTPPKDADIIVSENKLKDSRSVEIKVSENMPTWFMSLVGVKTLSTPAASTATESVGQVEISLILDLSGSMNDDSRLTNLKPAAKAFIDKMFDTTEEGKLSISIIPYATQVAISEDMASYFKLTAEQTNSACIEFENSKGDFATTAVSLDKTSGGRLYQRQGDFDPFTYYPNDSNYKKPIKDCPTEASRRLMPFSGNRAALKSYIDGFFAEGNTSIDIGLKWGAALLDPSMKPVVTGMVNKGQLPSEFSERPYPFGDKEAMKIIVLMTDGANTTEYRLRNNTTSNPYYDEGTSNLMRNPWYRTNSSTTDDNSINQYSYYDSSRRQYYIFAKSTWRNEPWGSGSTSSTSCDRWGRCTTTNTPDTGTAAVSMTWQEVWQSMALNYYAYYIVYGATGRSSDYYDYLSYYRSNPKLNTTIGPDVKDPTALNLCNAAKANGIRIYTIAFEAPTAGQQLLSQCQNAGYYAVEGLNINEAFSGIANSINKLRLTH